MRFVVDAQLPPKLARLLVELGHEAIHVAQLRGGITASDLVIASEADVRGAVVISKDSDFKHSHLATGTPKKLLLVELGNISNLDLFALVHTRSGDLVAALSGADFVELRRDVLVVHASRTSDNGD